MYWLIYFFMLFVPLPSLWELNEYRKNMQINKQKSFNLNKSLRFPALQIIMAYGNATKLSRFQRQTNE